MGGGDGGFIGGVVGEGGGSLGGGGGGNDGLVVGVVGDGGGDGGPIGDMIGGGADGELVGSCVGGRGIEGGVGWCGADGDGDDSPTMSCPPDCTSTRPPGMTLKRESGGGSTPCDAPQQSTGSGVAMGSALRVWCAVWCRPLHETLTHWALTRFVGSRSPRRTFAAPIFAAASHMRASARPLSRSSVVCALTPTLGEPPQPAQEHAHKCGLWWLGSSECPPPAHRRHRRAPLDAPRARERVRCSPPAT